MQLNTRPDFKNGFPPEAGRALSPGARAEFLEESPEFAPAEPKSAKSYTEATSRNRVIRFNTESIYRGVGAAEGRAYAGTWIPWRILLIWGLLGQIMTILQGIRP